MAGEGEDAVSRDYTFTVQVSDVPSEYTEKVRAALDLINAVACGEITKQTYIDIAPEAKLNENQLDAVTEFDHILES